ncbi:MAG: hypothetical protein KJP04_05555, partial [Arenicella sp.]|nr:hypothetical protein [Arenicella sp.]
LSKVQLETGRTHQIRLHMNHIGFPLVGDQVYGRRLAIAGDCAPRLERALRGFQRQALHAARIQYRHPVVDSIQTWEAPMPEDMQALIEACTDDSN